MNSRLLLAGLLLLCGCFSTRTAPTDNPYYDLYSEDPVTVQGATRAAGDDRDPEAIPHLIHNLRHDDTWVRLMSLRSLLLICETNDPKGYAYGASEDEREQSVRRWEDWYQAQQSGARPAPSVATPPESH